VSCRSSSHFNCRNGVAAGKARGDRGRVRTRGSTVQEFLIFGVNPSLRGIRCT
jgi:hypothetical protein